MPKIVRLPGHVPDDELRVWWERSEEGDGLHVYAPRRLQRYALAILDGERLAFRPDAGMVEMMRASERLLERGRSPLDELEAAGYDPRTVVFSIRKKGEPAPRVDVAEDVRSRLDEVQAALARLTEAVSAIEEAKGLYVMDDSERGAITEASEEAAAAVAAALDTVTRSTGLAPAEAVPAPAGTNVSREDGVAFDKVMVLSWEDLTEDDEEPGSRLFLRDKDRMVGEVYKSSGGYHWRCKASDWRAVEDTLRQAKDNLVADYCQHYAHQAREALREALRDKPQG